MPFKLYLDDCAFSHGLVRALREAGHTVVVPADVGLTGVDDDVHMRHAIEHGLVVLTKDPHDFETLHQQMQPHPGVLAVCQDNDPDRDMNHAEIVASLALLEQVCRQSGLAVAGQFHILNQWRGAIRPPATREKSTRRKSTRRKPAE